MNKLLQVFTTLIILFLVILLSAYIIYLISHPEIATTKKTSSSSDINIIAVGDIQCSTDLLHPTDCRSREEAEIAKSQNPTAILLLGDEQYGHGTYEDFKNYLDNSWGKLINIVYPAIGNHDYLTPNAAGFYEYFRGKNPNISLDKSYYSFNIKNWHLIALDTNCGQVGGCTPSSIQYLWLEKDLEQNPNKCVLAFFHHPLFSSGTHGNNLVSKGFWDLLYKFHVDVILNGHDHIYERFAPQTPAGQLDSQKGIRQFTVGTGGGPLYKLRNVKSNSQIRNNNSYGVLKLTLNTSSYSWKFLPVEGATFTDSGSAACQ